MAAPDFAIREVSPAPVSKPTFMSSLSLRGEHQALINAVHQAWLAVEDTVFEPAAAAYAAVLPEDRARGVALVDIGAQSTDIVVYDGDAMLRASSIPVSGDFFTSDVAFGMTVSFEDAESTEAGVRLRHPGPHVR